MPKNKKTFIPLIATMTMPIFGIISCGNNDDFSRNNDQKNGEQIYKSNELFVNKLNNERLEISDNTISKIKEFAFDNIIKKQDDETINIEELPKSVIILNSQGFYENKKVTWNLIDNTKAFDGLEIFGNVEDKPELKAKTIIITSNQTNQDISDSILLDDFLKINIQKSTRDGSNSGSNLNNLLDRSDSSESTGSMWHNWWVFGKKQNNNIIFNSETFLNINKLEVIFGNPGDAKISNKVPKEIRIKYSDDGVNLKEVKNQNLITAEELGEFGKHHTWNGSSKVFSINFSPIKTKWINFTWVAPQNNNNQDLAIAITDMKWFGKISQNKKEDININSEIELINFENKNFILNSNNQTFKVNNLPNDISIKSKSTFVQKEEIFSNENTKIYKLISNNDLNIKNVYTLIFKKENE
ncbi:hypothetical protein [Mesomycoplasma molare]|uniref:Lipoprotein n=1 Tax=Mesomycoplasma molare TaxID=171288 RepID=A0ABY5TX92_9BACT|nr:hypothetical protein [Mesomycoplasma molare]UWD34146.1 hypothetical protein NX772_03610 [Mesomycoplasma molare]